MKENMERAPRALVSFSTRDFSLLRFLDRIFWKRPPNRPRLFMERVLPCIKIRLY